MASNYQSDDNIVLLAQPIVRSDVYLTESQKDDTF